MKNPNDDFESENENSPSKDGGKEVSQESHIYPPMAASPVRHKTLISRTILSGLRRDLLSLINLSQNL